MELLTPYSRGPPSPESCQPFDTSSQAAACLSYGNPGIENPQRRAQKATMLHTFRDSNSPRQKQAPNQLEVLGAVQRGFQLLDVLGEAWLCQTLPLGTGGGPMAVKAHLETLGIIQLQVSLVGLSWCCPGITEKMGV